ncbi:MAG TPA: M48 family metalloprotease [Acidimicrobiales bacterium]|nr:M48 family metalloprotease [Acidimicrobiales bacterium]
MTDRQAEENRRRARTLVGACLAAIALPVFLVLAVLGHPFVGLLAGVAVATGVVAVAVTRAEATALAKAGAVPADPRDHARFHNVVEGLSVAAGVPKPALHVIDDDALNALTVGRDARHASLAVTTGLLRALSRIELEGVLAHELSHVRHLDILPSTLAVGLLGPVAPGLIPRVVEPRREDLADVTGVSLTRYPPGLISALEKVRDHATGPRSTDRAIAHLWLEAPDRPTDRPPLEERIQALREL